MGALHQQQLGSCHTFGDLVLRHEHEHAECMKDHNGMLGYVLVRSSPYLYPFVIEFMLIGASVFYLMWLHVGKE